jgi:hypothetical protein
MRPTPTHPNKPSLARWLSALLLLSCTAMSIHATDEAGKLWRWLR